MKKATYVRWTTPKLTAFEEIELEIFRLECRVVDLSVTAVIIKHGIQGRLTVLEPSKPGKYTEILKRVVKRWSVCTERFELAEAVVLELIQLKHIHARTDDETHVTTRLPADEV